MPDFALTFCASFALLGTKLLFYSAQAVSFGSVLLTACVAAALAQLVGGTGGTGGNGIDFVGRYVDSAVNYTCAGVPTGGPLAIACALAGHDTFV
jgi:hypothetical protein